MKKHIFFLLFLLGNFLLSPGQTKEDVQKLGLTNEQLITSFEKRRMILTNNSTGKRKIIKERSYAKIKMKGNPIKFDVIMEAFLTDTIIVSTLVPQLQTNQINLKFQEFKLLPLKDIELIEYTIRHRKVTFWAGFVCVISGVNTAVLTVIMPLILGNAGEIYSQPRFPITVASGVIIYFVGRKLLKSLTPKDYNLESEWNYRIEKK